MNQSMYTTNDTCTYLFVRMNIHIYIYMYVYIYITLAVTSVRGDEFLHVHLVYHYCACDRVWRVTLHDAPSSKLFACVCGKRNLSLYRAGHWLLIARGNPCVPFTKQQVCVP